MNAPQTFPAYSHGSGLVRWLEKRIEAAHRDAAAHPEGSSNRTFYRAQATAYENALSAHRGTTESLRSMSSVDFQARSAAWMEVAFEGDPTDLAERVARFGEESLELQQALGLTREDAHRLVDYVFDRPAGTPATEFGQAHSTLALLAAFTGHDLQACGEAELARVSSPEFIAKLRGKRATRHGRGPLPGFSAPGTSELPAPVEADRG